MTSYLSFGQVSCLVYTTAASIHLLSTLSKQKKGKKNHGLNLLYAYKNVNYPEVQSLEST